MQKPQSQFATGPLAAPSTASERNNTTLMAWAAAIGLHLLLLGVFALWQVGWRYDIPEWVEMQFVTVNTRVERPQREIERPAPAPATPQTETRPAERRLNLPQRRMLEDETPQVRAERPREIFPSETRTSVPVRRDESQKPDFDLPGRARSGDGKSIAELQDVTTGEKTVVAESPDFGRNVEVPFVIEGEAASRNVMYKVIPEYPPGLASEAVVKLSFVVLPSGVVANIVPVLKGDATLERVAIEAFRQWRFNSLPPEAERVNQQGVITFRFVLR